MWKCPFCNQPNQFPRAYAENIRPDNLPAELYPQYTTLEYVMPTRSVAGPPVFLFVVDSYSDQEELDELKDSLQQSLSLLPETALVGLITFGAMVMVHEIGFSECPKAHVFRGTKMHDGASLQNLLGMTAPGARGRATAKAIAPAEQAARFLLPVGECSFMLETILEDLQRDGWPVQTGDRPTRCTGAALAVAVGLLEVTNKSSGGRIMLFTGGPCNCGPGQVATSKLTEAMRSHNDIMKGLNPARFHKQASTFYNTLGASFLLALRLPVAALPSLAPSRLPHHPSAQCVRFPLTVRLSPSPSLRCMRSRALRKEFARDRYLCHVPRPGGPSRDE